jgi:hypothetical protein
MDNKKNITLQMTQLWRINVALHESSILALALNNNNSKIIISNLFNNQRQLGRQLAQHFDKITGNRYEDLLTEHVIIAIKIVMANLKNKNPNNFISDWHYNAECIAKLLNKTVNSIDEMKMKKLLFDYLDSNLKEIDFIIKKKYSDVTPQNNNSMKIAEKISDYISNNIKK